MRPQLTDDEVDDYYGPWQSPPPAVVADLFARHRFPWWIAGGWALEAAGADPRPHHDLDISVLARDADEVRDALSAFHVWESVEGFLRPLPRAWPVSAGCHQFWVRRDAGSPWYLDVLLSPCEGTDWVYRRDDRVRRPVEEIGFVRDGVPYLRPEIVLLFKSKLLREQDQADVRSVLPAMDAAAREWLAAGLETTAPDHPWIAAVRS